jgi:hypothetical protein
MAIQVSEPSYNDPDWEDLPGKYLSSGGSGRAYEDLIHKRLQGMGLVPAGFSPAGSTHNQPDFKFYASINPHNMDIIALGGEAKLDVAADFGQCALGYENGSWVLTGATDAAAQEMKLFLRALGVEEKVNMVWGSAGAPRKWFDQVGDAQTKTGRNMLPNDIKHDHDNFKDIMLTGSDAPSMQKLFKYYAKKNTYYIQIGKAGFYYMAKDPARLNNSPFVSVPQLSGSLKLRIRRKPTGSRNEPWKYSFTTAIQVDKKPKNSPIDLEQWDDASVLKELDPSGMMG